MEASPTILAIASPPGRSLRGIIRISGHDAVALVQPHLQGEAASSQEAASDERAADALEHASRTSSEEDGGQTPPTTAFPRGAHRASLSLLTRNAFRTTVLIFPAPHSYTGEDSIELQLPGNPILLERVVDALLESARARDIDARRAEPGEFTAHAFLNSRLSLTQAEGVAATIAAQSDAELAAARLLVSGRLADFAHNLANDLAVALALVEAGIDFTDQENVVAIAPADLYARLSDLRERLDEQLAHAVGMEQLRAIPWVVLVGEPNAGKSALFNALLGRERAVVSPISGTTRDVLAEPLMLDTDHGKAEVMLVDLAGLDELNQSPMNALMQARAREALGRAELRLRCVPPESPKRRDVETTEDRDEIVVHTKADLGAIAAACGLAQPPLEARPDIHDNHDSAELAVSARTGEGLNDLRRAIAQRLSNRAVSLAAGTLALQPRHESAMRSALAGLNEAIALVAPLRDTRSLPNPELMAFVMRAALDQLASLAGDMTPDDILGRIFATFCVGK
jgi:tRNA modification GTPase